MRASCARPLAMLVLLLLTGGAFLGAARLGSTEPPTASRSMTATEETREAPQQRGQRGGRGASGAYKLQITPHWLPDNLRFWYRNDLSRGTREFILVDAERGTRQPAFDHQKLAGSLSKAAGVEYSANRLPFDSIEFVEEAKAIQFKVGNTIWKCNLASYECAKVETGTGASQQAPISSQEDDEELRARLESPWPDGPSPEPEAEATLLPQQPRPGGQDRSARSPDGKWEAFIKNYNVFVRSLADGKEQQLSQDGKSGLAYGLLSWAPDSTTLAAFQIEPGDRKEVYLIESSPAGGGRAKLSTRPYALPGDKFTFYELNLFDPTGPKQLKPEVERIELGFGTPRLRWKKAGHTFTYQKADRGHQRFRLMEVDAQTGKARPLIDEKTDTFIWTAHRENLDNARLPLVTYLEKTDEVLYASERDGWRHLYLIDTAEGRLKTQITRGEYVVRGIQHIDEEKREITFLASGKNPDQDPYFLHCYRVNFDGTGLVALTEGNGSHTVQFSPDRKFLIDTYSRVDLAPIHELRRAADGKLICRLEEADITELKANGWEPPEVFVAKGCDGKTDIWGIICRPKNFDPNKKYPVIEDIYAGPQGSFVPKTFSPFRRYAQLADLGFIVAKVDGMGTANRSKAFHDVCWHNLKDAGFPDRILWHQAAAKKYPSYDISRVGIYGTSAGGQNAAAALLFHPEFYKAAFAACGCHDNRMDKASWNEQWMGYPVGPQYSACSNIDNASKLQGKLMLLVGELDDNVPPESTFRLVNALIKAGKDFDLIVMPGLRHTNGGTYGTRRMQDFFVRHLLGVEPPDRNGARGG